MIHSQKKYADFNDKHMGMQIYIDIWERLIT